MFTVFIVDKHKKWVNEKSVQYFVILLLKACPLRCLKKNIYIMNFFLHLQPVKWLWCWEGLGAGGKGEDRGWDGWMASPTWWTWVWVNSESWGWTGRPGVLWFMGLQSQTQLSDWTELNWRVCFPFPYEFTYFLLSDNESMISHY